LFVKYTKKTIVLSAISYARFRMMTANELLHNVAQLANGVYHI